MSDDVIAKVEALHGDHRQDMKLFGMEIHRLTADIAAKDAEIERLNVIVERQGDVLDGQAAKLVHIERDNDRLRAELAQALSATKGEQA